MVTKILKGIRDFWRLFDAVNKHRATELLEWETRELENIFSILVLGSFVGIQAPPMHLSLELLPDMENELEIMLNRVCTAHEPLSDLFSMLDCC
ncbi:MAG: hypothetical protein D6E12_03130 [Desulfovibrio sp.]|nr:MAG: hypothetical protein D6E12_03130 [Desulfovibrio sp.]